MPPADNRVGAKSLTQEEQALVRRWIDEGATVDAASVEDPIQWQSIASDRVPIFATSISPNGRYVSAGRGTQLEILHVPSRKIIARPTDSRISERWSLPPATDVDILQTTDFSPDGEWLATGAFRTIKLWRRSPVSENWPKDQSGPGARVWHGIPTSRHALFTWPDGRLEVRDLEDGTVIAQTADDGGETQLAYGTSQGWWTWNAHRQLTFRHPQSLQVMAEIMMSDQELSALAAQSSDGREFVTAGTMNGQLLSWDVELNRLQESSPAHLATATVTQGHGGPVTVIRPIPTGFQPDGSTNLQWLTGGADGKIVARGSTRQELQTLDQGSPVTDIALTSAPASVIVSDARGNLKWWDLATSKMAIEVTESERRSSGIRTADRALQLAKLHSANANTDKTKAEERIKQEKGAIEQNEKEIVEADKKIEETSQAKEEKLAAATKVAATLKESEEAFAAVKAELDQKKLASESAAPADQETQQKEVAAVEAKLAAADTTVKDARKAQEEALKAATDATAAFDAANQQKAVATGALTRSRENLARAETTLAEMAEQSVKSQTLLDSADANLKQLRDSTPQDEDAILSLAIGLTDPPLLVVLRKNRQVEIRHAATGELWEAQSSQFTRGPLLVAAAAGQETDPMARSTSVVRWIVGSAADAQVSRLRSLPDWTLTRTLGDPDDRYTLVDRVLALDFSADSKLLASGGGEASRSGELKIWNVVDGTLVGSWQDVHSDTVFSVKFSPDDQTVASGAADRFAKTSDVKTGKVLRVFEGHTHYVQSVGWRADGRVLATAGADKAIKFWDPVTGEQINTLNDAKKEVTGVVFLGLENRVVASSGDGQVQSMLTNGQEKKAMTGAASFLHALDATMDGQWIVAAGADRIVRLWGKDGALAAESKATP